MENEMRLHLSNVLIPFWKSLQDSRGGFYGRVNSELQIDKDAPKGVILNSRILWFFSNCYLVLGDKGNLKYAEHAYNFLIKCCYDENNGGVFWMLDKNGGVLEDVKYTYNQAFAIYALCSYYDASGDEKALELAFRIFDIIEGKAFDGYGYKEAFTPEWSMIRNDALSGNGIFAQRTMNTILHLIEAYTALLKVKRDNRVYKQLHLLINLTAEKVYDPVLKKLNVYFDDEFNVLGDIHSFGHDIEASWLLDKACLVLGDISLQRSIHNMGLNIADAILQTAYINNSLIHERDGKEINTNRVWWVQAEAVVGFMNAYLKSKNEKHLLASNGVWGYIKENIIDKRAGGEWHYLADVNGDHSLFTYCGAVEMSTSQWKNVS